MERRSVHCNAMWNGDFFFVKKKIRKIVANAQKAIEGKKNDLRASLYLSLYSFLDQNVPV